MKRWLVIVHTCWFGVSEESPLADVIVYGQNAAEAERSAYARGYADLFGVAFRGVKPHPEDEPATVSH